MNKAKELRSNPPFPLLPAYNLEVIKNAMRLECQHDAAHGTPSIARPAEGRPDDRPGRFGTATA